MITILSFTVFTCLIDAHIALPSKWHVLGNGKCQFTISQGASISFEENPPLFVNLLKAENISRCRELCCSHQTCNGYVWDRNDGENCKLLKCSSQGQDCKAALKPLEVFGKREVGFITGMSNTIATTPTPTTSATATRVSKTTSEIEKNKIHSKLVTSPEWLKKKLGYTSPAGKSEISDEDKLNHTQKQTGASKTRGEQTGVDVKNTKIQSTVGRVKMPSSREATAAATEPLADGDTTGMSSLENHTSHTDTVSLSVAFVFGICFLLTVVVLLGRRWIEGMKETHKRGYTRISYLLNGDTHCMN